MTNFLWLVIAQDSSETLTGVLLGSRARSGG